MPVATAILLLSYENQKYHQEWPNVSWGTKLSQLRATDFNEWQTLAGQPQSAVRRAPHREAGQAGHCPAPQAPPRAAQECQPHTQVGLGPLQSISEVG